MNRNELVISELKSLGFPMPNIRKALLQLVGTTQADIASEIKMGQQSMKKYIAGFRYDLENQKKIADALDVPVDQFFSDANRKHESA